MKGTSSYQIDSDFAITKQNIFLNNKQNFSLNKWKEMTAQMIKTHKRVNKYHYNGNRKAI